MFPVVAVLGVVIVLALALVGLLYLARYLRSDHRDY
jgi:hypothetical protein